MNAVLSDTSCYVAFVNPRDIHHAKAIQLSQSLRCKIIVTEFVLIEFGDAMSNASRRQGFAQVLADLRADANVEIIPASSQPDRSAYGRSSLRASGLHGLVVLKPSLTSNAKVREVQPKKTKEPDHGENFAEKENGRNLD